MIYHELDFDEFYAMFKDEGIGIDEMTAIYDYFVDEGIDVDCDSLALRDRFEFFDSYKAVTEDYDYFDVMESGVICMDNGSYIIDKEVF